MSQKTVQLIIGQIVTDEDLRAQFLARPFDTLAAFRAQGFDLTAIEVQALMRTDRRLWSLLAASLDPSLQRCSSNPRRSSNYVEQTEQ
jgi:hypothetical protein